MGADGVGCTVIVNDIGSPRQFTLPPVFTGVTVMVEITGSPVLLVAINDAIFPVPLAGNPMEVLLFVQV